MLKILQKLCYASILASFSQPVWSQAMPGSSGPMVKRKVLILDFVNKNKDDQVNGYLVETIPDAIIDPLNDTKAFELLPIGAESKVIPVEKLVTMI